MSKRDVVKIGSKQYHVVRDKAGRFIDITSIDKITQKKHRAVSKMTAKPSHGHAGSLEKRNKNN